MSTSGGRLLLFTVLFLFTFKITRCSTQNLPPTPHHFPHHPVPSQDDGQFGGVGGQLGGLNNGYFELGGAPGGGQFDVGGYKLGKSVPEIESRSNFGLGDGNNLGGYNFGEGGGGNFGRGNFGKFNSVCLGTNEGITSISNLLAQLAGLQSQANNGGGLNLGFNGQPPSIAGAAYGSPGIDQSVSPAIDSGYGGYEQGYGGAKGGSVNPGYGMGFGTDSGLVEPGSFGFGNGFGYSGTQPPLSRDKYVEYAPLNSIYGTPNTGYGTPNTGYGTPNTGYGTPNTGYETPNAGFGTPNIAHGAPNTGYGPAYGVVPENTGYKQPNPIYGSSNPGYGPAYGVVPDKSGYAAPNPIYGAPNSGYGSAFGVVPDNTGYAQPNPIYGSPNPGYGHGYEDADPHRSKAANPSISISMPKINFNHLKKLAGLGFGFSIGGKPDKYEKSYAKPYDKSYSDHGSSNGYHGHGSSNGYPGHGSSNGYSGHGSPNGYSGHGSSNNPHYNPHSGYGDTESSSNENGHAPIASFSLSDNTGISLAGNALGLSDKKPGLVAPQATAYGMPGLGLSGIASFGGATVEAGTSGQDLFQLGARPSLRPTTL